MLNRYQVNCYYTVITMDHDLKFPKGFLWGTATAAHQIEGHNDNNNWWTFEQKPGNIKNGDTSEIACDHWNRYQDDFDWIKKLNNNAYRMSIEWSRIFPKPHEKDPEAIEHYHNMLDEKTCTCRPNYTHFYKAEVIFGG